MPQRQKPQEPAVSVDSPEVKIAVINNDIKHIFEGQQRLEAKFDLAIQNFVTIDKLHDAQKSADEKHQEMEERIKKLEAWNDWAVRIVLGAVITAVLGMVLVTKVA